MKRLYVNEPELHFNIPTLAPAPVAKEKANFDRLASEYREIQSQIAEALELRQHEIGKAHAAAATARIHGTPPPAETADKVEAAYDNKLAALRAELAVVTEAVDQAGDALLDAIAEHKAEWFEALLAVDRDATDRLAKALDVVDECLAEISQSRSAPAWLREFRPSRDAAQYSGARSYGQTGRLREIVQPPREMKCYRGGVPIYQRFAPERGCVVFEYADGREVEPEVAKEIGG